MRTRYIAMVTAAVMVAPMVAVIPPSRSEATEVSLAREPSVPGRSVTAPKPAPGLDDKLALRSTPRVSWPSVGAAEVSLGTGPVKAGSLPVSVSGGAKAPGRVAVEMLPRQEDRLPLRVRRTDAVAASGQVGLEVDYSGFANAYGGDWAVRLRLVSLPECALSTPERTECAATPIPTRNNGSGRLTGTVTVPAGRAGALYAVMAGASSGAGSYAASTLSPSSTWSVGTSSGDFSWEYPMDAPPGLGGPEPQMSLTYSSGNVDGRGSSTNNQPSWVGEGFEFDPGGYIERRYKSCADDTSGGNNSGRKTGDLCWASDSSTTAPKSAGNAYVVMNGRGGELVRDDATGTWKPRLDDGSKVELLTGGDNDDNDGEYWRITSRSGTQYYFGKHKLTTGWTSGDPVTNSVWTVPVYGNHAGEPCRKSTFDASVCEAQAWRWNLDYVVDRHGNTMSLFYEKETNYYARNNTATKVSSYVRGGYLKRIDYGQRDGEVYTTPAVGRVEFTTAGRCIPGTTCTSAQPANWPDVPWNQACTSKTNCNNKFTPTFWTQNRLKTVTTKVWNGSAYQPVDSWELTHSYPNPGDGTRAGMWLASIRNTGHVGDELTLPEISFDGVPMHNRVDGNDYVPPMNWMRMRKISLDSGGEITVEYTPQECVAPSNLPTPDDNDKRCHPVRWTPEGETKDREDWFNKYVVTQVTEADRTTGLLPAVTRIEYPGKPAWRYDDRDGMVGDKYKTWSQWRGYDRVRMHKGSPGGVQSVTESLYFRGMDGDRTAAGDTKHVLVQGIPDADPLAGTAREIVTYGAGNAVQEKETVDPWLSAPTATRSRSWGTTRSYQLEESAVRQSKATGAGQWQTNGAEHIYSDDGLLTQVTDLSDVDDPDDDTCTRYWYASNESAWIIDAPYRIQTVTVGCDKTPTYPDHAMVDIRYYYDGNNTTLGAVPTRGVLTKVEELSGYSGDVPRYVTVVQARYDVHGRVTETIDAKGARSTVAYTPATSGPLTQVKATNALGHVSTTTLEPAWGLERSTVDANGRRTEMRYDPHGRLAKLWLPGRDPTQSPSAEYSYLVRRDGANVVTTRTLLPDGGYDTEYELYDGLMRPRQTQAPAPGGGRLVSDTVYDSRGLLVKENGPYYNDAPPGPTVLIADEDRVPAQIVTVYDESERPREVIFRIEGVERWRTTHTFTHNRHDTDPLDGDTPTTELYDAEGRLVELRQYHGNAPTGPYDATKYTYNRRGQLQAVTDPVGNVWRYSYDLRGFMTRAEEPDRGVTEYTYDDAGELLTEKDARELKLAHTYDILGRRTGTHDGSPSGPKRIGWTYDTPVNGKPALGYQTSATRYVDGNEYTTSLADLDAAGRVTATRYTIPRNEQGLAGSYEFTSTFKVNGDVATASLPAVGGLPEEELAIGYDRLGLPVTLSGADTYVTGTAYTQFGEVRELRLSAGGKAVKLGYGYEYGTHRLSRAVVERDTAPGVIADVAFKYDQAGNVMSIADRAPGAEETQCFRYDHLRRATEAWTPGSGDCAAAPTAAGLGGPAPYWHSWTLDKTGNRTSETRTNPNGTKTTSAYTYPATGQPKPHAVSKVTTTGPDGSQQVEEFGYDAAGNMTARKKGTAQQAISWDPEGNIGSITKNGVTTSFLYDAGGNRLIRRDSSGTTLYLGETELHLAPNGTVTGTRYYSFNGRTVAVRTSADDKLHWLAMDHHGTPEIAIDAASQEVKRRRFTPYGEARGATPAGWPGQKSFVGGTADPDTGLVHLGARDYDPSLGRFISVDPIVDLSDPQQLNSYAYANNNPATYADPDGERWVISTRMVKKMRVKMVVEYRWERVWRWVRKTYEVIKKIPPLGQIVKSIERLVLISYQVLRIVFKFVKELITVAVKSARWVADKVVKIAARAAKLPRKSTKNRKKEKKWNEGGDNGNSRKKSAKRPKKSRPEPKKSPHIRRDPQRRTNPGHPQRNIIDNILRGAGRTAVGVATIAGGTAVVGAVSGAASVGSAAGAGGIGAAAGSAEKLVSLSKGNISVIMNRTVNGDVYGNVTLINATVNGNVYGNLYQTAGSVTNGNVAGHVVQTGGTLTGNVRGTVIQARRIFGEIRW
ncbi:RHS repeat-associated core domain-containing protein [Plantactinospora sp. B6F1]|uniref:RHS repeat domain-containing protein n=1 Tax=Plantactinospora sp. B6F1 TaxID=3158971 RepID=UPI0032D8F4D3